MTLRCPLPDLWWWIKMKFSCHLSATRFSRCGADKPQKGRYQEFYQCDVDVVGSESLLYEAELVSIYHEIFKTLGIGVKILINNRKILYGIAQKQQASLTSFRDMTVAIDKLDKIGLNGVTAELQARGLNEKQIQTVVRAYQYTKLWSIELPPGLFLPVNRENWACMKSIAFWFPKEHSGWWPGIWHHPYRGLSYYTGCIFGVKVDTERHLEIKMGSIGGGGRYDNLTGILWLTGCFRCWGFSWCRAHLRCAGRTQCFPQGCRWSRKIDISVLWCRSLVYAFGLASQLRSGGISCDVYPDPKAMNKQMNYNKRGYTVCGHHWHKWNKQTNGDAQKYDYRRTGRGKMPGNWSTVRRHDRRS